MERQIDVQSPAILLLLAAFGLAAIFCPNRLPFTSLVWQRLFKQQS